MELLRHPGILIGGAVLLVAVGVRPAVAQRGEARGEVTAVSDSSLTLQSGARSLTFVVDPGTHVEAPGVSTRIRRAEFAGVSPQIRVTDYVEAGRPVLVSYREIEGKNHALIVRPISSAGSVGAASDDGQKVAQGKVKMISPSALTLEQDGRDVTYSVDSDTHIVARGAGKATKNGGVQVTDLVRTGDIVSVSYKDTGGALKVSEIRMRSRSTIPAK